MRKILGKFYHSVVNANQWFQYGKDWLTLPFIALTLYSQISILMIFLDLPRNPITLTFLIVVVSASSLLIDYWLFKFGGHQIGYVTQTWRNLLPQLGGVGIGLAYIRINEHFNTPFPEPFKRFSLKTWVDLEKTYYYILNKGVEAKAQPICRKFFGVE